VIILEKKNSYHFLIVGNSHEHIFKVIDYFHPSKIFLISSHELRESIELLQKQLNEMNVLVECIWVNPFQKNAIMEITSEIIEKSRQIKQTQPNSEIYIGFTGGTNLMAISAGYSALLLGVKGHYLIKGEEQFMVIDVNEFNENLIKK
jgi:3-dehydroquinate synthetase